MILLGPAVVEQRFPASIPNPDLLALSPEAESQRDSIA
jgi:hypothetical protein